MIYQVCVYQKTDQQIHTVIRVYGYSLLLHSEGLNKFTGIPFYYLVWGFTSEPVFPSTT
ncbi:hypothetical protein DPMN_030519 [Dreissena polymorpha]|uniref:Uncharacterized protein n=1 Tax=Dreissena polymorpha TaxID=45954 RepID=A0A9D4M0Z7_DREPO|nr:hypothetical protein DPMN_030519 [Dreissena polymorpha]